MPAFVSWVPEGLSLDLDLMRRDRDSGNGLMEFMVIELLQRAKEIGITQVSLNVAMFRSVFFEESADLLCIGLAAGRAEGFLQAPGLPKWMHRGHLETTR